MPLSMGIWKNSEYKDPIEFYNLSNKGRTLNFDLRRRNYYQSKLGDITRYDFLNLN
jgi:hypothetical protein